LLDGGVDGSQSGSLQIIRLFAARHLLLRREVIEGLVVLDRATQSDTGADSALIRLARIKAKRRRSVECAVLHKSERIAMDAIPSSARLHIDGSTSSAA